MLIVPCRAARLANSAALQTRRIWASPLTLMVRLRSPAAHHRQHMALPPACVLRRLILSQVDALHSLLEERGIEAPTPRDAPWGERYFHLIDPDGHELSFATPQYSHPRWTASVQSSEALGEAAEPVRMAVLVEA